MRSALTGAPVASFTTLPLRTTQHATGLMVKVARFSHRETCSHHKGSLPGHTHKDRQKQRAKDFYKLAALQCQQAAQKH